MTMAFYRVLGSVALIEINNPPVNALSLSVLQGLVNGIKKSAVDARVKAVVICGKGKGFIAGADIGQFGNRMKVHTIVNLCDVGRVIEASEKPVVAAIHGVALGGGLEVALFCHYRLALKSAKLGFPEIAIGLLPGAEGTQRLPRLVGLPVAIDMITTGRHVPATVALKHGLVCKVVEEDVVKESVKFAQSVADAPLEQRRLRNVPMKRVENVDALFDDALARANRKFKGFIAPLSCVKAVRASVDLPYEEGCEVERDLFQELVRSDQAKALMYAFFAERAAVKWRLPSGENFMKATALPVKTTAVIGAGTMGSGITIALLIAGFPVRLLEQDRECLEMAVHTITSTLEGNVRSARMTSDEMKTSLSLLTPTDDINQLKDVDIVIEAVFENLSLKMEIFSQLDKICKPEAILCTNSSTLDIDTIASATSRPDKVIGSHFFAPPHIMRLLETVYGSKTSGSTVATMMKLGKKIGKIPVLVGTCHAFVANRTFFRYSLEALFLIEEGALPHEVDQALEEFGMPVGPFKTFDISGTDVVYRIRQEEAKAGGYSLTEDMALVNGERYCSLPIRLYHKHRLGQKNGKGWYRYDKPRGKQVIVDDEVTQMILDHSAKLGMKRRKISSQEIVERCWLAAINEGFSCLEDGVAAKPGDINVIWLYGFGFPRYRGGPMYYAHELGLKKIHESICYYHKQFPTVSHWMPSELLRRLAESAESVPMSSWNLQATSRL